MPFPLLIAALAGKAAHSGAKSGTQAALEETQRPDTSVFEVPRIHLSDIQINAMNDLLKQQKYAMFEQLRQYITHEYPHVHFASLIFQQAYFLALLEKHPHLERLIHERIEQFFDELERQITEEIAQRQRLATERTRNQAVFDEQQRREREAHNALERQLFQIKNCQDALLKMDLLQQSRDDKHNSIGHVSIKYRGRCKTLYFELLESLTPENLLVIFQLKNTEATSIFDYCYASSDFNLYHLLVKCIDEDPEVFCKILLEFKIDTPTIQSIVNTIGCKKNIRSYIHSLSNNAENRAFLKSCLDSSTNMGKFCLGKADSIWGKAKHNQTKAVIEQKISQFENSHIIEENDTCVRTTACLAPPRSASPSAPPVCFFDRTETAPPLPVARPIEACSAPYAETETLVNARPAPAIATIGQYDTKLWVYAGVSILVACGIYAITTYANTTQEKNTTFSP
ncbi:MAG: hypothetical protein GW760_01745 [Legionella sp.]|nr:hypothetical protein [Legionella sp.]